jgi:hypothetical protein
MKKSAQITLTLVAAMGIAARAQSRPDPCVQSTFNEQACQEAVRANGYCWNGKWVRLKYHYPFPYYYDLYAEYLLLGGAPTPAEVGTCRGSLGRFISVHSGGASHGGFGSTGAGHCAGA